MRYVPVGRIISACGIKGEVKFRYYNEEKEVFYMYTSFFIQDETGWKNLKPKEIKFHKGHFFITFKGLERIEDVSFLTNLELFIRDNDLPQLSADEYYEYQLIGLDVYNEDNEALGKTEEIIHTGANDVLLVKGEKEILVPMTEAHISEINIERAFIRVKSESLLI